VALRLPSRAFEYSVIFFFLPEVSCIHPCSTPYQYGSRGHAKRRPRRTAGNAAQSEAAVVYLDEVRTPTELQCQLRYHARPQTTCSLLLQCFTALLLI